MNPVSLTTYNPARPTPSSGRPVQAPEAGPQDAVTLTGAADAPRPKGLAGLSVRSAFAAAAGVVGAAAVALWKPVKSLIATVDFGLGFMGDMRTRAMEISESPEKVEAHLKAQGLHQEYTAPKNHTDVKLQGMMTIRANMSEFFQLWDSWIAQGFGSINDRQYADLVLKFRDQARDLPLLAHMPMVSEDAFSVVIEDGKMVAMTETTTAKFAGLIPTSKVDWVYQREGTPRGSNSFEKTIDAFDGDVAKIEAFYNDLFDPRKLNPDSKATVEFRLQVVDSVKIPQAEQEFQHSVRVPLGALLPRPRTTLGAAAPALPGPAAALALREGARAWRA